MCQLHNSPSAPQIFKKWVRIYQVLHSKGVRIYHGNFGKKVGSHDASYKFSLSSVRLSSQDYRPLTRGLTTRACQRTVKIDARASVFDSLLYI